MPISKTQFTALASLLRLRNGPTQVAVYHVLVEGMTVPDAARAAGMDYKLAYFAVQRARNGFDLARSAVLPAPQSPAMH